MAIYIKKNSFWVIILVLISYLFVSGINIEKSQSMTITKKEYRYNQYVQLSENTQIIMCETAPTIREFKENIREFEALKKECDSLMFNCYPSN